MREALAQSNHDFIAYDQPRPARRKSAGPAKKRGGPLSALAKKPMRALGFVVIAGVLAGIGINATMFQTARHPAPLFASPVEKAAPSKTAALPAPVPAPRPAELAALPAAKPAPAQPALRPPAPLLREMTDAAAPKKDVIASLLKADAAPETPNAKAAAAGRALQKVGFPVKPGADMRQSLERFESDRGLPVTGKLAGRTLKELSAQSGVAIP